MIAIYIIAAAAALLGLLLELKRDLMMLQQNSYMPKRYKIWLNTSGDTTSVIRLIGMAVVLAAWIGHNLSLLASILVALFSLTLIISLVKPQYKKPLVWTKRAVRIYSVEIILVLIVCPIICLADYWPDAPLESIFYNIGVTSVALYAASHILTVVAVTLLQPVENSINRGYRRDAERILREMPRLKIIGVTGSYGKTSTKHYLKKILETTFDVAMTPGNFNTTLGVIRTVREYLKPYNEVFIVEMGAKQTGDIKDICDLVHPTVGIVTAVGEQHLESFGSIENVQRTKFELVDSLPSDGLAVVNNDFPYIASRKVDNVECIRYGVNREAKGYDEVRFTAEDIVYGQRGTTFTVVDTLTGNRLPLRTQLVGECNVSNLLAAVAVALHLGVTPENIRYAVEQIRQVEHRLSLRHVPGGVTIIDDAYNSNPAGSKMALDVLAMMRPGRRFIITPGMIELGERQEELNRKFGFHMASCVDVAIIVGLYNRDAIVAGLSEGGFNEENIHTVDSFTEGYSLMLSMASPGDTVLFENDLPDTFR